MPWFDKFMMMAIIANIICLAMGHYDMDPAMARNLEEVCVHVYRTCAYLYTCVVNNKAHTHIDCVP